MRISRFARFTAVMALAVATPLAAQRAAVRVSTTSNGSIASTAAPTSAVTAVDTAITRLQDFLTRYPNSTLRPSALFELGELLVRQADEAFAAQQRASAPAAGDSTARASAAAAIKPDYSAAIARYEELVQRYPNFERIDAAAYTLGTLYATDQRYPDAVRMFSIVAAKDSSKFRPEALFRLGDAYFEIASREAGEPRRATFAQAANAYEKATSVAPENGDIYFLSLYKLGWAYYNQANQSASGDYQKAVDVFGRLVDAYDKLSPEQQARLGLRAEAIEYMAVAFTQVGGSDAANAFFAKHGGAPYEMTVMRRVAQGLRDQGDFSGAVKAYRDLLKVSPNDTAALAAQEEIVDIYQNRTLEPDSAQAARLRLVDMFAPGSAWAQANPSQVAAANKAREEALRQAAQYELAAAQSGKKGDYGQSASLYKRYLDEFGSSDSAQVVNRYYAEALFGEGDYSGAGAQFLRTAYTYKGRDTTEAQAAGRNAIVAYDSALVRARSDRAVQDSMFAAVDRYVAAFPNSDVAKKALIEEGKRASETQRWDAMANAFRTYAARYPKDPYTPPAQRLIGDALYKGGQYAEAQSQWEKAQQVAAASGRTLLADSIASLRTTAAAQYADTLLKQGQYQKAAEDVYVAYAEKNPGSAKAPDALRNAIETYYTADSVAKARGDQGASGQARDRVVALTNELAQKYPTYKYRVQYQARAAKLLADEGKRDDAVAAYQQLIAQNPSWPGRADAMIRVAVMLDSLGKEKDAAAAYADFARAFPSDSRAAGALNNAAVSYVQAGDTSAAVQAYATLSQRYPRDAHAEQARLARLDLLKASGDTAAVKSALADVCVNPTADLRSACNANIAERNFRSGVSMFSRYQPIRLVIPTRAQLTAAGVRRASAQKQALLQAVTAAFAEAIKSGVPEYVAAGGYYVGLAQWEYGNFVKNAQLPAGLTDAQRTAAEQGAAQQAEQYFQAAKTTWQELVEKAQASPELAKDPKAAPWLDRARNAVQGNVDSSPPGGA